VKLCVYLSDETARWYAEHRDELGRGWASRAVARAIEDAQAGKPEYDEAAGDAALERLRLEHEIVGTA
jgi:hypothetical protein